jgi:hypothetical protein
MSRGQLFTPTFQAQTVTAPRLDNSVGESIGNAFGSVYKQLQAEQALEKEQQRYDLERARIAAQDEESRRRWELARDDNKLEREATAQRWEKTFGIQQAQERRALQEYNQKVDDRNKEREALQNTDDIAKSVLDEFSSEAVSTVAKDIGTKMQKLEQKGQGLTPEEHAATIGNRLSDMWSSPEGRLKTAMETFTTDEAKDALYVKFRQKGMNKEDAQEAAAKYSRGFVDRDVLTATRKAEIDEAKDLIKLQIDAGNKLSSTGSNVKVGSDGNVQLVLDDGSTQSVPKFERIDVNAAQKMASDVEQTGGLITDTGGKNFIEDLKEAREKLLATGKYSDLDVTKALTKQSVGTYLANKGKYYNDPTSLMLALEDQIKWDRDLDKAKASDPAKANSMIRSAAADSVNQKIKELEARIAKPAVTRPATNIADELLANIQAKRANADLRSQLGRGADNNRLPAPNQAVPSQAPQLVSEDDLAREALWNQRQLSNPSAITPSINNSRYDYLTQQQAERAQRIQSQKDILNKILAGPEGWYARDLLK